MKVVIVDDDQGVTDDVAEMLRTRGFEVDTYYALGDATGPLTRSTEPFVLILDHDFGDSEGVGYDLCRAVRREHPYGLILPIIYRSGKESIDQYVEHDQEELVLSPTAFLSKTESLATTRLPAIIEECARSFEESLDLLSAQSVRQAILELQASDPEGD